MNKKSKAIYEAQEESIVHQSEAIVEYLKKTGVIKSEKTGGYKTINPSTVTASKKYHNTELLLKKYRLIIWVLECIPDELGDELLLPTKNLDEIISRLDLALAMDNRMIQDRLNAAVKTRVLVSRVQEALCVLKKHPVNGQRLYDVIYATFFDPQKRTIEELLEYLDISKRTYYRAKKEAIEIISIRLWSSPSGEVDTWLDVLALVESL